MSSKDINNIKSLFRKYIDDKISRKELDLLLDSIKKNAHKEELDTLLQEYWTHIPKNEKHKTSDKYDGLFEEYMIKDPKIRTLNKKKTSRKLFYRIASIITIIIGSTIFFSLINTAAPTQEKIHLNNSESITLTLQDGSVKVISENGNKIITDTSGELIISQEGNELQYKKRKQNKELVYNELNVPYGKHFDIVLSDGTKVKLNSGSSLNYPVAFLEGKNREVYLKGEAFFDVAKDIKHPFIVKANDVNVQVLGTQFNISYYPEDPTIQTVLIEGSVNVNENNINNDGEVLTPGQMAEWSKTSKSFRIKEVDTEIYTSWIENKLVFKSTSFEIIKKKLERKFNIVIDCQYSTINEQVYTATFLNESIEDIMDAFQVDTPFDFVKENNKIVITKPSNTITNP